MIKSIASSVTRAFLRRYLKNCRGRVLDIGGGTRSLAELISPGCSYTCLDNEMPKLRRCATKVPGSPLLADATYMPVRTGSIDTVTCANMTHHLTYDQLHEILRESARVLNPAGSLVLMDAVLNPSRLPGWILWKLDRGAYPKPSVNLRKAVEQHFVVEQWVRFAVYHEYVVAVCRNPEAYQV